MLRELDPFGHATTYEEENVTLTNHFDLPSWTFASVEALGAGDPRLCGGKFNGPAYPNSTCHGGSTKNHHDVSLQGYRGKPVFMCEGHDLWRSWWQAKEPNVVRAAWAVTTAAASFTWTDLGHAPDEPYLSSQTFATYPAAAHAIDVVAHIMTKEVPAFYSMVPADELLVQPVPELTFCLAEHGAQYIVYSDAGAPFTLQTDSVAVSNPDDLDRPVQNFNLSWFDAASGAKVPGGLCSTSSAGRILLTPPQVGVHWVAMLLRIAR